MKKTLAELEKERLIILKRIENHTASKISCIGLKNRLYLLDLEVEKLRLETINKRLLKKGIFKTLFGGLKWKI